VAAASAAPSALPNKLKMFANCPVDNPAVTECIASVVSSGEFSIGSESLKITSPITITLGMIPLGDGLFNTVAPDNGTPALDSSPIPVPIFSLPPLPGVLSITATQNLVSLPQVNVLALETGQPGALSLPLTVSINNALIGPGCTIGTSSDPINISLTTGTTNPPGPNTPISGSVGKISITKSGVVTDSGSVLVDNSFAVPGANGCGLFGLLDGVLDLVAGLPAAGGKNTAILNAKTSIAPASLISKYVS
jgi:hypothetical protein